MEGYEGKVMSNFQNVGGFEGFSQDSGKSHQSVQYNRNALWRSNKGNATRAMQKERGHVLDVLSMADHHDGISRRGHRKLKAPSGMGDIVSSVSGPRLPGQGCNQLQQEIVSAMCLDDRTIVLRITILASGFVIGPRGSSIKMISERCNVDIESKTVQNGEMREFKCSGIQRNVVKAVQIMKEAVNTYKILTEGDYRGQCVQSTMVILGITFDYCPPPKSKMPHAASVITLSQKLAVRKEENSSLSTMDSSSSVDSTQGLEPYGFSEGNDAQKDDSTRRHILVHKSICVPEDNCSLQRFHMDSPWRESLPIPLSEISPFSGSDFSRETNQIPGVQNPGRIHSEFISPSRSRYHEGRVDGSVSPWGTFKGHRHDGCAAMRNLMREYGSMDI